MITNQIHHTHPELKDEFLRTVLANEILVLRRNTKGLSRKNDEMVAGIHIGMETRARRIQDINHNGLKAVYNQNYEPEKEVRINV